MHIIMVTGTLRALSVSKILMGRIASQNMNALVMFKRVGARLRKLKSKNKNLSGKGKLTDSLLTDCKTIMGLLFVAMLETYPVFSKMLLLLCFIAHQVSRKPMHGQCPIGKDGWCYYQRALSCG
ncbi:hypothetical protein TNCV_1599191 [Trichonephila clavipes]|nr:hypothetical protein TNCV_1599191 [Trichonephila clavipes]